jgi:hypothetical protein
MTDRTGSTGGSGTTGGSRTTDSSATTDGATSGSAAGELPARDLVDVRLTAAIELGGCAICAVRARSERATLDAIIAERVLDLGFREGLERQHGFCRRHSAELLEANREASGILGSSMLFGAMVERRLGALREALRARGRARRQRLTAASQRPPCIACTQGASAVEISIARLVERSADPAWASAMREIPFCLDDLTALLVTAGDEPSFAPIAEHHLDRLEALRGRLAGYADHSAQDRRHLMKDEERTAADEAARLLAGD